MPGDVVDIKNLQEEKKLFFRKYYKNITHIQKTGLIQHVNILVCAEGVNYKTSHTIHRPS